MEDSKGTELVTEMVFGNGKSTDFHVFEIFSSIGSLLIEWIEYFKNWVKA